MSLPKLLYGFNTIPIKISAKKMEKLILRCIWNHKGHGESKHYHKIMNLEDPYFLISEVTTKLQGSIYYGINIGM